MDNSNLPALVGNQTLIANRALLDFAKNQLHFLGPGELQLTLPPGSESFQLEMSPSGHMVLPCDYHKALTEQKPTLDSGPSAIALPRDQPARAQVQ